MAESPHQMTARDMLVLIHAGEFSAVQSHGLISSAVRSREYDPGISLCPSHEGQAVHHRKVGGQ